MLRLFQSWIALGVWNLILGARTPLSAFMYPLGLSSCLWPLTELISPCLGRGAEARLWLVLDSRTLVQLSSRLALDRTPSPPQTAHWSKPKEENARQPAAGPQSGLTASKAVFVSSPARAKGNLSQQPQARGWGLCLLVVIEVAVAIIVVTDVCSQSVSFHERKCHFLPITGTVTRVGK